MFPPPNDPNASQSGGRYVTVQLPRLTPYFTIALLSVTIAVFLAQIITQYLLGFDLPSLLGLKVNQLILRGEVWRLITPVFLHGSLLHIGFNLYALYILGPALESHYGHGRFLALYLISGFAGNVLSFLFSSAPSLGSSTAIFGLLGAEGIFLYRNREIFGARAQRALGNVILIAVVNLVIGMSPGIDNWGHVGGLLAGTFFAWFAGPLYHLEGDSFFPRLVDEHGNGDALRAGIVDGIIFAALAAMKFVRGF
jgi:rhomboid protease GluP